jgi:hypothetical protein
MIDDNYIMAYNEGINDELKSWKHDMKFIQETLNYTIDRMKYINSGIVVYSNKIREYISPDYMKKYGKLFESIYPHQAWLNYIIQSNNLSIKFLSSQYNTMFLVEGYNNIERKLEADNIVNLKEEDKIYHITGFYINRYEIIKKVSKMISMT